MIDLPSTFAFQSIPVFSGFLILPALFCTLQTGFFFFQFGEIQCQHRACPEQQFCIRRIRVQFDQSPTCIIPNPCRRYSVKSRNLLGSQCHSVKARGIHAAHLLVLKDCRQLFAFCFKFGYMTENRYCIHFHIRSSRDWIVPPGHFI